MKPRSRAVAPPKRVICTLVTATLLGGCGSILTGTTETIRIKSEVPGAEIFVDNRYIGTRKRSSPSRSGVASPSSA